MAGHRPIRCQQCFVPFLGHTFKEIAGRLAAGTEASDPEQGPAWSGSMKMFLDSVLEIETSIILKPSLQLC